jgi:hypothetical protein
MSAGTAITDNAEKLLGILGAAPATDAVAGTLVQTSGNNVSPARTSLAWPCLGVPTNTAAQAAEVGNFVAVPVAIGDVFKTVGVLGGSAAAGTVAEYIVALYAGKTAGVLLAQSKSATPGSHPKEEFYESTLEKAVTITAANAPAGYIWVQVSAGAAGTMFSFYSSTYTTAGQEIAGKLGKSAPPYLSAKGGAAIKTAAEAVLPTLSSIANVPIVALF